MKNSTILFLSFIFLIGFLISKGCDKNVQISDIKKDKNLLQKTINDFFGASQLTGQSNANLVATYQREVNSLNAIIQEKESQKAALVQERDKAQVSAISAQNSLAQWILLAQSHNTNTPLTEHMDTLTSALLENTKSLSGALKTWDTSKPRFNLVANGVDINEEGINVVKMKNRIIFFQADNVGGVAADNLTLNFGAVLEKENFVSDDRWQSEGRYIASQVGFNIWTAIAPFPITPENPFSFTSFSISTNYEKLFLSSELRLFSSGSKLQKYNVVFVVDPEPESSTKEK